MCEEIRYETSDDQIHWQNDLHHIYLTPPCKVKNRKVLGQGPCTTHTVGQFGDPFLSCQM